MSQPQTANELLQQVTTLLQKHEVHNDVLACELSIMILQREKTALKLGRRVTSHIIDKAFAHPNQDQEEGE